MVAKEATWAGFRDIIGGKEKIAMTFKESVVLTGFCSILSQGR
jgi:hypothetical protein